VTTNTSLKYVMVAAASSSVDGDAGSDGVTVVQDHFPCVMAKRLNVETEDRAPAIESRRGEYATQMMARPMRVFGKTQVTPSTHAAATMKTRGLKVARAQVIFCANALGAPSRIYFAAFSGSSEWDRELFEAMRDWRYEPSAEGFCRPITFSYRT
jgi:hypothetical protein